jgi:predicted lipid carrier protein YhbT
MAAGPTTIAEAIEWLRKRFRPDLARDVHVTYQLELSGPSGGVITASIDDGQLATAESAAKSPDVVLHLSAADYFGILAGRENPDILFMDEKIRIDGDLSLALKLRTFFRPEA